jgi:V/A-type H+-transporting ATPase subunit A
VVARAGDGSEIALAQWWPVRSPRPFARKLTVDEPLVTGQRVIDVFFPLSKAAPRPFPAASAPQDHDPSTPWPSGATRTSSSYIGCVERGNEMTDVLTEFPKLVDPRTGAPLMDGPC